jgi:hypothetical protein
MPPPDALTGAGAEVDALDWASGQFHPPAPWSIG